MVEAASDVSTLPGQRMLWTVNLSSLFSTFVHLLSSKPKEKLRSVPKQICTKLQKGIVSSFKVDNAKEASECL